MVICISNGCFNKATHGFKKVFYCIEHAPKHSRVMVCLATGCKRLPKYGINRLMYCYMHKKDYHFDIPYVNFTIISKLCMVKCCKKRAYYGNHYCKKHNYFIEQRDADELLEMYKCVGCNQIHVLINRLCLYCRPAY